MLQQADGKDAALVLYDTLHTKLLLQNKNSKMNDVLFSWPMLLGLLGVWVNNAFAQMSTDPGLCGGYMRDVRGHIDFVFNENTAPPDVAQREKFCMWTISPTVPQQQTRYNITIRNVNLDCNAGDKIAVNFFTEDSTSVSLGTGAGENPLCIDSHIVWQRNNAPGTTMVVVLYVEEVQYGKGFYMEWQEGFESWIVESRVRNTYYSFGKSSVAPLPYFAASFMNNEISTFGFVKANFSTGYMMELYFDKISYCYGPGASYKCYKNTITIFEIEINGSLKEVQRHIEGTNDTTPIVTSRNGIFIIVKGENTIGAGGNFVLQFDTVRG